MVVYNEMGVVWWCTLHLLSLSTIVTMATSGIATVIPSGLLSSTVSVREKFSFPSKVESSMMFTLKLCRV